MYTSTNKSWIDRLDQCRSASTFWLNLALSLLMLLAVLQLFHPVFDWAWRQLVRPDRQYHIVISIAFIGLCAYRLAAEKHTLSFAGKNVLATLMMCVVCTAYVLNQHYLQLNALSVALFLMFCFALFGHFVSAQTWRSCALPLLLAMLVLPFEGYLDIFLGFPMRLLSAEAAVNVLQALGVASVSSDTVLLIDNRAAIVDIDCSGIRGFWIGSVFFCAMTWLERYRMNGRWLLIGLATAGMLFVGNVVRIVALVVLDLILNKPELAQRLHETLGLLTFAFVIFFSWWLLRQYAQRLDTADHTDWAHPYTQSPNNVGSLSVTTVMLTAVLFGFNVLQTDKLDLSVQAEQQAWRLDALQQRYTPETLNAIEQKFFVDNGAQAFKFSTSVALAGEQHAASVLVVLSGYWKAQHIPEHCYLAQGYDITASNLLKFEQSSKHSSASFRQLNLVKNRTQINGAQAYTSDYWFQSQNTTTVNYSGRVIAQLRNPHIPWAMVSVLWHDGVPNQVREQLLLDIRETINTELNSHG